MPPLTSAGRAALRGPGATDIALRVNGESVTVHAAPRRTLLDTLRETLGLTGTKKVCDEGTCGACTVLVEGRPVYACMTFAVACEGKSVETIEGIAKDGELHPVQRAFIDADAFQCGFCTPGQIMSAVALIAEGHTRSHAEIREWMSGNICRCSSYPQIVAAVVAAAEQRTR